MLFEDITLPAYAKEILNNYLIPSGPGSPPEMLLLALNVFCSRILCHNRVKIKGYYKEEFFPNIYGLTFAISGAGKDRVVSHIQSCYEDIFNEHREQFDGMHGSIIMELDNFVLEKSKENKDAGKSGWSKSRQEAYVLDNTPREACEEMSSATPEGFVAAREILERYGFGSLHFSNSEFLDYIMATNVTKEDILDILKDCYELGHNGSKITKGDKTIKIIKGVPQTMLVFSSIAGLLKEEKLNTKLDTFFNRGFARRSLVCYPEPIFYDREKLPFQDFIKQQEKSLDQKDKIKALFKIVNQNTQKNLASKEGVKILIENDNIKNYIYNYENYCAQMAEKIPEHEAEPFKSILLDSSRKIIRLASVICAFEQKDRRSDGNYELTVENFEMAREQVEFYYEQFTKFYNRVEISDTEQVYLFILKTQDKKEITKMLLRDQKFAPARNGAVPAWLSNLLDKELPEYCAIKNKELVTVKGRNYKHYRIIDGSKSKMESLSELQKEIDKNLPDELK